MVREFGYEYDAVLDEMLNKQTCKKCVNNSSRDIILLRSGRDALKAVAREYENAIAFLPSLACDSMVLPFEMFGHKVVYYSLNVDYSANFHELMSVLDSNKNKKVLFLYMNYFGNLSLTDEQLEHLKSNYSNLIFIEDRTHDLLHKRKNSFVPDYTAASLRKWINVPDGGLLWGKALKNREFSEDTSFSENRRTAQCMRNEYLQSGDENLKTEFRRIFSTVTDIIDNQKHVVSMSEYSYQMAKSTDWESIRKTRESNAKTATEILLKCDKIKFIQKDTNKSNLYVPVLIENRDDVQSLLSSKGIFTTLIWPLNDEQKKHCKTAEYTERCMLGIPCDQRYNQSDMEYIAAEFIEAINQ